jgi:conjugative transposon TraK protein
MDKIIKYFDTIETSFRKLKFITVASIASGVIIALGAVYISGQQMLSNNDNIYVIDRGSAVMAARSGQDAYRDLEVKDHIERFHELTFNLSPNSESIKRNLDRALVMSDKSAYDYWSDLSERGFYSRIVSANISQEIVIDSVKVDMSSYPYQAKTYAKVFMLRESNITAYDFESSCRLVDVERSPSNPHGLMIEKFRVSKNENMGTRQRD